MVEIQRSADVSGEHQVKEESAPGAGQARTGVTSFPEGGWGWMVTLGGALIHTILLGCARSFGILYLELLDRFQGSAAATVFVWSLCDGFRMIPGPVVSLIADRFTCRKAVMVGGVLACLGYVTSAFATQLYHLYLTLSIITGFGMCLMFVPTYIIIGQYFDKKKGKAMGLSTLGTGIGTMAFPPLAVFLLREFGYSGTMLLLGGVCLNGVCVGALYRPVESSKPDSIKAANEAEETHQRSNNTPTRHRTRTDSRSKEPPEQQILPLTDMEKHKYKENSLADLRENDIARSSRQNNIASSGFGKRVVCWERAKMLKNKNFLLFLLTIFAMPCVSQVVVTFTPSLAIERDSVTDPQAALLITLGGATDAFGRFFFGFVFDIKSLRGHLRLVHSLIGISLGITTISLGFVPNYISIAVGIGVWGFLLGGFHGQRATILSELVPPKYASLAVGILIFVQGSGNIITTAIGGLLKDYSGTYTACFIYPGGFFLTVNLLCFCNNIIAMIWTRKQRPPEIKDDLNL